MSPVWEETQSCILDVSQIPSVPIIESECDGVYLAQVIVERIAFGGGMCISMPHGFSWTQVLRPIRLTRIAASDYHRVIAILIYPTQCSKCLSGVLMSQFQSLI